MFRSHRNKFRRKYFTGIILIFRMLGAPDLADATIAEIFGRPPLPVGTPHPAVVNERSARRAPILVLVGKVVLLSLDILPVVSFVNDYWVLHEHERHTRQRVTRCGLDNTYRTRAEGR